MKNPIQFFGKLSAGLWSSKKLDLYKQIFFNDQFFLKKWIKRYSPTTEPANETSPHSGETSI